MNNIETDFNRLNTQIELVEEELAISSQFVSESAAEIQRLNVRQAAIESEIVSTDGRRELLDERNDELSEDIVRGRQELNAKIGECSSTLEDIINTQEEAQEFQNQVIRLEAQMERQQESIA